MENILTLNSLIIDYTVETEIVLKDLISIAS